ncbi:hypothetical protein GJAV_G00062280 [Gymnothorax javanicus]|nr:hypothetical protein GJAV_G00062280 [Gymnothorax javanicus]
MPIRCHPASKRSPPLESTQLALVAAEDEGSSEERRREVAETLLTALTDRQEQRQTWRDSSSAIDHRSTAENCQNRRPPRWHGGNFEHVQNFRSATAGWANPHWDRRGTAMTAMEPYKDLSSTSITVVPPQYNCRAIAKKKVVWRPYSDPMAVTVASL